MIRTINIGYALLLLLLLGAGCRKRDALLPDSIVNFETARQAMAGSEDSTVLSITLTRPITTALPIEVTLQETGLEYGVLYRMVPAPVNKKILLVLAAGQQKVSLTVYRMPGALFYGDEQLQFSLGSVSAPARLGVRGQTILDLGERIATTSAGVINGGGTLFPNKVFMDLSANRAVVINRSNWDLGFYSGADDFRVILNSSSAMMARATDKIDMNQVGVADTIGLTNLLTFSLFAPLPVQLPYMDYPNGDLTRTAITAIAQDPAQNKVYLINRGSAPGNPAPHRGWKKLRVLRDPQGYRVQCADLNATTYQEWVVPKDNRYHFNYLHIDNGVIGIEPEKAKWDLAWCYFSNTANFGSGEVPYLFQDMILLNRGVQAARVLTTTRGYASFSADDLASLSFSSSQIAIGADWRTGGGPGVAPAVRTDRFYIVRDPANNYYKIRFTALLQQGERGYPSYEAALVKKG